MEERQSPQMESQGEGKFTTEVNPTAAPSDKNFFNARLNKAGRLAVQKTSFRLIAPVCALLATQDVAGGET
jgi:hypothetical protein